jgi:hypothetical protein
MYDIIKDFASPLVTLIAASIAGLITFTFARLQVRVAKSQRDIALDKLKFDLFQKRYEIYISAKKLLVHMLGVTGTDNVDHDSIRDWFVTLDESRFYFSPTICQLLSEIKTTTEHYLSALSQRGLITIDHPMWTSSGKELMQSQIKFRDTFVSLPEKFEAELAFKQLTSSQQ